MSDTVRALSVAVRPCVSFALTVAGVPNGNVTMISAVKALLSASVMASPE